MIFKHQALDSILVLKNFLNSSYKEHKKKEFSHLTSFDSSIFEKNKKKNESLCKIKWKTFLKPIILERNYIKHT